MDKIRGKLIFTSQKEDGFEEALDAQAKVLDVFVEEVNGGFAVELTISVETEVEVNFGDYPSCDFDGKSIIADILSDLHYFDNSIKTATLIVSEAKLDGYRIDIHNTFKAA